MSAPASTCSRQSSYDCYQSTWGEQVQPEYDLERLLRKSEPQHRSPPPMSFVFLSTFPLLSALPSATALDTFKQQSLLVQPLSGRPRITTCVAYLFTRAQPRLPSNPSRLGPLLPHSTALELKAIGLTSQPPSSPSPPIAQTKHYVCRSCSHGDPPSSVWTPKGPCHPPPPKQGADPVRVSLIA